uniref:Uncharacterized protein n=1 Tax=Oryza rufipogon TaxID=4529 RepID=A0A0E0PZX9_ORYRU
MQPDSTDRLAGRHAGCSERAADLHRTKQMIVFRKFTTKSKKHSMQSCKPRLHRWIVLNPNGKPFYYSTSLSAAAAAAAAAHLVSTPVSTLPRWRSTRRWLD